MQNLEFNFPTKICVGRLIQMKNNSDERIYKRNHEKEKVVPGRICNVNFINS